MKRKVDIPFGFVLRSCRISRDEVGNKPKQMHVDFFAVRVLFKKDLGDLGKDGSNFEFIKMWIFILDPNKDEIAIEFLRSVRTGCLVKLKSVSVDTATRVKEKLSIAAEKQTRINKRVHFGEDLDSFSMKDVEHILQDETEAALLIGKIEIIEDYSPDLSAFGDSNFNKLKHKFYQAILNQKFTEAQKVYMFMCTLQDQLEIDDLEQEIEDEISDSSTSTSGHSPVATMSKKDPITSSETPESTIVREGVPTSVKDSMNASQDSSSSIRIGMRFLSPHARRKRQKLSKTN